MEGLIVISSLHSEESRRKGFHVSPNPGTGPQCGSNHVKVVGGQSAGVFSGTSTFGYSALSTANRGHAALKDIYEDILQVRYPITETCFNTALASSSPYPLFSSLAGIGA